ncbi:Protein of unknown function [Sanguibacter gelidistatuariae]|uniref:DUF2975 domain-containing protein n=1 Tax=Sanguibacter gelidistatuariae TaxID=1814289 RepID=A0A1G6TH21_9MICO|nr:DUF2975 domain-containing protein [Sanguibacter gelidistatuariae]SDD28462.1 Protein of unknown function [Sanguibacter gelidistatuariae]
MAYTSEVPALHEAQPRSARWIRVLAGLILLIGVVAGGSGVIYAVNSLTIVPATVHVPVTLLPDDGSWDSVQLAIEGVQIEDGWITTLPPAGFGTGDGGQVTVAAWGSTYLEQFLSRGDVLVGGLALLAGAMLLRPILLSVAAGSPFATGNARRLSLLALVIAVAGSLAPLLPQIAGVRVLERLGLADDGIFSTTPQLTLEPLLVAALVLVVAAAFRSGEQLARDSDGLV